MGSAFTSRVGFTLLLLLQWPGQSGVVAQFKPPGNPDNGGPFPSSSSSSSAARAQGNCSNCRWRIENRIRQMQHLERMKQRIMSAIRSNGNTVAVPTVRTGREGRAQVTPTPTPTPTPLADPQGPQPSPTVTADNDDVVVKAAARSSGRRRHRLGVVEDERPNVSPPKPQLQLETGVQDADRLSSPSSSSSSSSSSTGVRGHQTAGPRTSGRGRERGRKIANSDRGKARRKDFSKSATSGPKIVSFSRVLSTGKRKHVLQFKLSPSARGKDLEVVRAHLWLLLTHDESNKARKRRLNAKAKAKAKTTKARRVAARHRRRRVTREANREEDDGGDSVGNLYNPGSPLGDGKRPITLYSNDKTEDKAEEDVTGGGVARDGKDRGSKKERNEEKKQAVRNDAEAEEGTDGEEGGEGRGDGEEEREKERSRAVLRVTLVSENGQRRLLTYVRTRVRTTQWQKVRLPVSSIQRHLASSTQPTLTLVVRCRHCGRSVRMVLPEERGSTLWRWRGKRRGRERPPGKGKKQRGRKRQRGRRHGSDGKEKRGVEHLDDEEEVEDSHNSSTGNLHRGQRAEVTRRRKGRGSRRRRYSMRSFKNKYRPSPFLVINTRFLRPLDPGRA